MRNITWTYILHSFIFLFRPFRRLMMLRRVAVDLAFFNRYGYIRIYGQFFDRRNKIKEHIC